MSIDWLNKWKEYVGLKKSDKRKPPNPGHINNSEQLRRLCIHNKNGENEED